MSPFRSVSSDNLSHVPYISRAIARRMVRLLHMEYKPSEIADELDIHVKTIYYTFIPEGLPHRRDPKTGRIWIVGTVFREWALASLQTGRRLKKQRKTPIGANQSYCVKCKGVVDFKKITRTVELSSNRIHVYGICSICDSKVVTIKKKVTS